jgi:SH3-like domain-containing protein
MLNLMKLYAYILAVVLIIAFTGTAMAERLAVAVEVANIRSGPGTTYDIVWKVGKYHPFNIVDKSGPWYHFRDFEGDEGWIHKSLIQNIATIITDKEECNVRSGPGTNSKTLFTVGKGIPFKVLERKGKWIHIQHADGDQGWIHESLVW